jgi:hypothetical protein
MDVCLVIKQRLEELGREQRDLAGRRRGHGVLHFTAAHSEKIAAGTRPHRHLRQDGEILEALNRPFINYLRAHTVSSAPLFSSFCKIIRTNDVTSLILVLQLYLTTHVICATLSCESAIPRLSAP